MYILVKDLCRKLNSYSKVLIYGAGQYAHIAYQALKKEGLRDKVKSFLVTDADKTGNIDGINVEAVNILGLYDKTEIIILIAVSRKYEKEIVEILKKDYNIENGIKLFDYIIQDDNAFYEKLRKESDEWVCENLMEYYIWNHIHSEEGFEKKRKETAEKIRNRNSAKMDGNMIVFISGNLNPRSEKIIVALVKKNYHLIVLEYGFCNELVRTELMTCNIDFFHCRDMIEVFYSALLYKPLIYYIEPAWGDCSVSEILVRHKGLFGKMVFALYDIMNEGYVQISEKEKLMERYCLENADGIVWRWFSKEFLEEKKGFVYKGKSVQFLDYCKGIRIEKNYHSDDKLKLCFVLGGIYEYLDASVFVNDGTYVEPARIDTILNRIGKRNDCIFHLFVGRCDDSNRKKLKKLEEEYSNFKVFYGMTYNELLVGISEYDYGCFLMMGGKRIPGMESIDNVYYGSIYINSTTNKFFDYLDAGIPIISTESERLCEYFKRYGVVVEMDISSLNIDYLKKNKIVYREHAKKARAELLIDNHIHKLIDFFNTL